MASKKSLSKQETVKKKLPDISQLDDEHFLHAGNSNSVEFQHRFSMQDDNSVSKLSNLATMLAGKSALPNVESTTKTQVSVEITSADSNANKQRICSSQKGDTGFLPETPMQVKRSHVTFSEFGNSVATDHAGDSEHISSMAANSLLSIGQPGYEGLKLQAQDWRQINMDPNEQSSSSVEQNRIKDSSLCESLSPPGVNINDQDKSNVSTEKPLCNELHELSERQTCTSNELVSSLCKSAADQTEVAAREFWIVQNQPTTAELLPVDRANPEHRLYSEYQNRLESLISQYNGDGQIVVHRSYPGVVEEGCLFNNYVPGVSVCPVQETACDLQFDDSVFPTKHRLSTSEEMRTAMMQARKQTNYRRKDKAGRKVGFTEGGLALEEALTPNYSRWTRPARNNLQLKYRNLMATLNRRAFNDWKSEISATTGQANGHALGQDENTKKDTNAFLERLAYLKCPRCHRRVSGIYGKPCPCQKIPYHPNLCNSKSDKRTRISNSIRASHRKIQGVEGRTGISAAMPKTAECYPSLHANCHGENETGRKYQNTGFLALTAPESLELGSKSNNAIKVAQLAGAAAESQQSGGQARDAGRLARSCDRDRSSFSNKTSRVSLKGFAMPDPSDRKSRPLREWEINQLEATLRKCSL